MKISVSILIIFYVTSSQLFAQSLDIKTQSTYHSPGKLSSKYEYYFDFWAEREVLHGRLPKWSVQGNKVYSVHYQHGLKDGLETFFSSKGTAVKKIRWRNDLIHGSFQSFYPNGRKKQIHLYVDGQKNGLFQTYYKNGQLKQEGSYQAGFLSGPVLFYKKDGQLKKQVFYVRGKKAQASNP